MCSFNVVHIRFTEGKEVIRRYRFNGDYFEVDGNDRERPLSRNRSRLERGLRQGFERSLSELEDPFHHPRKGDLTLDDLFVFPDLLKFGVSGGGGTGDATVGAPRRVKGADVSAELRGSTRSVVIGGDKAGKTSLLKRLYVEFRREGLAPIWLNGGELPRSGKTESLRKHVSDVVEKQYERLKGPAFEQLPLAERVLLLDDFQDAPVDSKARKSLLDFIRDRFGRSILFGSHELELEFVGRGVGVEAAALLSYQRYEIVPFGKRAFNELAERWATLGCDDPDQALVRRRALELCEKIESVTAAAGLPHTPWLLVVLLEQTELPDPGSAAKSGDYGHFYQAIITVALARSSFGGLNVSGKFTYLSEFAYHLYQGNMATVCDIEAREFHNSYVKKYDVQVDFERVRNDLVATKMLRQDGDSLAFRNRYVFAFFVGYWLSRKVHKAEGKAALKKLGETLFHDVSANVLVFLAHLTDDPEVLNAMREIARRCYDGGTPADISTDVSALNGLPISKGFFALPDGTPEANRQRMQEADDDRAARRRDLRRQDGRTVRALPEADNGGEAGADRREINRLRVALRTMRILGEILRSKALSMETQDKVELMAEVFGLERRILGYVYGFLGRLKVDVTLVRKRFMRAAVEAELREATRKDLARTGAGLDGKQHRIERSRLKAMWGESGMRANRFWFTMYGAATYGMIARVATALGCRELNPTLTRVVEMDGALPIQLVDLAIRLRVRADSIRGVDEIKTLHETLSKSGNMLAQFVIEWLVYERLVFYNTDVSQMQSLCQQMGFRNVPSAAFDPSRKRYSGR